ncbi:outer membrane beta-barrel protein [Niastella caeni]|nr:outer membrane beta-barrel protein [Niastella caeni]
MKKTTALLVVLFAISLTVFSQDAAIKGTVIDTSEKRNLSNAVIAVLRPADSVLAGFTRTDKAGQFNLQKLLPGKFILMVTRPAYADYFDRIEITKSSTVDLGAISLTLKSQLLQEVVVQHKLGAIRIKGDTTEYIADSFKLGAGATVEDLLKKLPGIQVDKDGKISAQGETVQKVLVDGEEFFSDDPTIATRGLTADAVDKVQAFDKKSDQAAFTGIDDGEKTKTINLQLKEDRKKGYFGKVELGSDANRYWNNNVMVNAFKGKRKFAAFSIMSNTGKTGLDWKEGMNYGANNNVEMGSDDAGGMYISFNGNDDEFGYGNYWGEGLPKGWNGGLHYSNKWKGDKIHLNSTYQYNKINTEAQGNTFSQYRLPDTILYVNDYGNSFRSRDRNRIEGLYEIQIDSFSSVKITAQASTGNNYGHSKFHQESLNSYGDTLSIIDRETTTDANNKNFNSTLLWKQKFKKQGRTISLAARQNYTEVASKGIFFSDNNYFRNNVLDSTKILDQQKGTDNITSVINSRITYTEPLTKRSLLEFNYSIDNNHRQSRIATFEKTAPTGKYEERIDSLSNEYSFNVLTQSGGINYRYAKPKRVNFSFGMNVSNAAFSRKDLKGDSTINYSFTNFYPQANLNWTMGGKGNLRFNYNGSTQAPSIDQIQPIQDITDQLNIRVGNPDLKQAFRHNFYLTFNSYKFLSERNIYVSLNMTATQHDFSTLNTLDLSTGRKTSKPVNVDGNYRINGYFYYGKKIKKLGFRAGVNGRFNVNHNTNFIDGLQNENDSYTFGAGPEFSYEKEKKFSIWLTTNFNHNVSKTSLRSDLVTRYWTQDHYVDANVHLPWKLEIGSSCNFNIRQKTSVFDKNNNSIRLNARLDRKLFKNDAARLRFSANDILDQNIGFNRNINSNFLSERTYDTIRRYFMLSFIWNFNKNGKPMDW